MSQLCWVHSNRYQGRHRQKHAGRREPPFDTARLTRILRNPHPPGLAIAVDAEIQLFIAPDVAHSCILLIKKDTGKFNC